MSKRIDALKTLKAKVEAGEGVGEISGFLVEEAIPQSGGRVFLILSEGSLDAARSLHLAVVPEISQYSIVADPTCLQVKIAAWPNGLSGDVCLQGEGWGMPGEDARAYLIAILDLLIGGAE